MSITIWRCEICQEETEQVQRAQAGGAVKAANPEAGLAEGEWEVLQAQAQEVFVNVRSVERKRHTNWQSLALI